MSIRVLNLVLNTMKTISVLYSFVILATLSLFTSCKKNSTDPVKVGLIAYYPFDGSANDASGNGNNGITYGVIPAKDRFGRANSAYYFDGQTSFIQVKDNQKLRLDSTSFTINYWVNLNQYIELSGSAILQKNNGPYQNGWNTSITGTRFRFNGSLNYGHPFYNVSGSDDPFAFGDGVIPIGKWTMVTIIYNYSLAKEQMSFYINGALNNVYTNEPTFNIPTPNANTSVDLFIGKNSYNGNGTPSYFFNGMLDDIRIYNRILNNAEIQKLYNATND